MFHVIPTECLLLCCELYFDPSCRSECLNVNVEYLRNIFGSLYCIFEIIFAYLGESLLRLIVKLRQGSGKDRQGMAVKAKGLKA